MEFYFDNGILSFNDLSKEQVGILHNRFRCDLLDSKIPHYRPITYHIDNSSSANPNNISKLIKIGYSYSEIGFLLRDIVLSRPKGKVPTILQNSGNIFDDSFAYIELFSNDGKVTTSKDSAIYSGMGLNSSIDCLVKDMVILDNVRTDVKISVVLQKGTGSLSIPYNDRLALGGYKPIMTEYKLYDLFRVRSYLNDCKISIDYIKDFDEKVLLEILTDYFKQEEVNQSVQEV